MVVLYFSCKFDVVVQGGELCLTRSLSGDSFLSALKYLQVSTLFYQSLSLAFYKEPLEEM